MTQTDNQSAKFSIPSIIAIIAAILSFSVGAFWGFVLAMVAIVAAVVGMIIALSPGVRGGMVSVLSLVIGGVALIAAVIKALMWLF